ncbi:MAG: prepilin-type N-terminal cleavage/methylation domain-containing protein [Acidimicrobiia bacterium]|nr:prepilin-type N-terminal cleavage/methylation domain-containing protein [Acidimicrobiia bacterium]
MQQHDTTRPVDPKEAGFTLSEVIVTVAIIGLLTLTVGFFFDSISAAFGFGSDLSESERQAREAMDRMTREIRTAASPDINGDDLAARWPIATMTSTALTFYSQERDAAAMRAIRYRLDAGTLYRGEAPMQPFVDATSGLAVPEKWAFLGAPPGDLGTPVFEETTLATHVVNDADAAPLFRDSSAGVTDPAGACVDPQAGQPDSAQPKPESLYQAVGICLAVDTDPDELPEPMMLFSLASWRNPSTSEDSDAGAGASGDVNPYIQWASANPVVATDVTAPVLSPSTWTMPVVCSSDVGPHTNGCVLPGDRITFTWDYKYVGGSTVLDADIEVPLGQHVDFVSASNGGTLQGGVAHWDVSLPVSNQFSSVSLTVQVAATAPFGYEYIEHGATLTIDQYRTGGTVFSDPVAATTAIESMIKVATPMPDVSITAYRGPKAGGDPNSYVSDGYIDLGQTEKLSIDVVNDGAGPATGTIVTMTNPTSQISYVSSTGPVAGTYNSSTRTVTWNVGTLDPGESMTFTATFTLASNASTCQSRTFSMSIYSNEEGTKSAGNSNGRRWQTRPCPEIDIEWYVSNVNKNTAAKYYYVRVRNAYTNIDLSNVVIYDDLLTSQNYPVGIGNWLSSGYGWNTSYTPTCATSPSPTLGAPTCTWDSSYSVLSIVPPGGVIPAGPGNSTWWKIADVTQKTQSSNTADCRVEVEVEMRSTGVSDRTDAETRNMNSCTPTTTSTSSTSSTTSTTSGDTTTTTSPPPSSTTTTTIGGGV